MAQDLLTNMNSYPFLDNKHKPIFTSDLADIVPRVRRERIIDISASPLVPAVSLRTKLQTLHRAGEIDGGLPIIRDGILVGLIPAPDLEFALDNLDDEESSVCLMAHVPSIEDSDDEEEQDKTDFTPYIDPVSATKRASANERANSIVGTRGFGYPLAYGSCLRMLRKAGSALHLRPQERTLCRTCESIAASLPQR